MCAGSLWISGWPMGSPISIPLSWPGIRSCLVEGLIRLRLVLCRPSLLPMSTTGLDIFHSAR